MVHALAVLAHAPAGQAVEHDLARHVEVDHEIEVVVAHQPVELARLAHRAREAVEHEPVVERAARREALLHDPDDDVVGYELAAVHVALGLEPERRSERRLGPEDVAGRQMRDAVPLPQTLGLGSLAGPLLPEQHEPRLPVPAQLRNPS